MNWIEDQDEGDDQINLFCSMLKWGEQGEARQRQRDDEADRFLEGDTRCDSRAQAAFTWSRPLSKSGGYLEGLVEQEQNMYRSPDAGPTD